MRVDVTPEEMRRFVAALRQFNIKLEVDSVRVNGQFRQLGETWRDQDYDKFAPQFENAMRVFIQFSREAEEYCRRLERKAEAAEEFLRR